MKSRTSRKARRRALRALRCAILLNALAWHGLSLAYAQNDPQAHEATELQELVLPVVLQDRDPVAVVVYRKGSNYFIPYTQAKDLGLPHARAQTVPGVPEPVIEALEVTSVEDELLKGKVPLTYFSHQRLSYLHANESADLEPLPAAWVNYSLFHQPTQGLRSLGGTISLVTNIKDYSLRGLWLLNREVSGSRLLRASTSVETQIGGRQLVLGDIGIAQSLPLLVNRQALGVQVRSHGRRDDSAAGALGFAGIIPSSGVLSVLANQQLLYRAPASVGTYELKGLPAIAGQTRYEVYFDDGQSVRLLDSLLTQAPVANLPKGAFEYQLSMGAPRLVDSEGTDLAYAKELVFDASATYGLTQLHQLSGQLLLAKDESWAGGALRTEWTPRVSTRVAAHAVSSSSSGSGVLASLSAHYSSADFRVGASQSLFSSNKGTKDGFLSESKAFMSYNGLSLTLLQSENRTDTGRSKYRTFGLSKSLSYGRLSVNFSASSTWRDGVKGAPYVAVLLNWALNEKATVGATVSRDQHTLTAHYMSEKDWGVTAERTSQAGMSSYNFNGFYGTRLGTLFASTGVGSNTFGLSGGVAVYKGPQGVSVQPLGHSSGDSLLVVDTGAERSEVVVESQYRYAADKEGFVSIPFSSSVPQRVSLDLMSLDAELTALETQHLVKTERGRAHLLKFNTVSVGHELVLKRPDGSFVPEGSLAYLPSGKLIVADEGGIWLEESVPSFKVQLGPGRFCTVQTTLKATEAMCE